LNFDFKANLFESFMLGIEQLASAERKFIKSMLQVYYKKMPTPIADEELAVTKPETAPQLAQAETPQVRRKNFPRRLAATHRSQMPIVVWLILSLIWGSTWLFIKLGLEDLPPFTFAGIRFVIAALILLIIIIVRQRPLPRKASDWVLIAGTGLLSFTLNYGLLFWGEQRVSSGLAAILQTIIPVFGLVLAHLHLPSERITWPKMVGVLLGIAGVGLIFSNQMEMGSRAALEGSVAIVIGAFAVAYSNVLVKARAVRLDYAVLAAGQMIAGLIPLLIIGIGFEGNPLKLHWTPLALFSLLYLAIVGSSVAFLLYYWLVGHMEVTKTMLISLVTPLIAVTLGMIVRGEELTWRIVVGGISITAGIGVVALRRLRNR
jgi:drug/metabolite transporter (DMT)-like permease